MDKPQPASNQFGAVKSILSLYGHVFECRVATSHRDPFLTRVRREIPSEGSKPIEGGVTSAAGVFCIRLQTWPQRPSCSQYERTVLVYCQVGSWVVNLLEGDC